MLVCKNMFAYVKDRVSSKIGQLFPAKNLLSFNPLMRAHVCWFDLRCHVTQIMHLDDSIALDFRILIIKSIIYNFNSSVF